MRNMAAQIFEHKQIKTTEAKAKELRGYVDRLITYGKKGTVHHRRLAFKFLQNKEIVTSLFEEIAPVYETRNGGYTRIIKLGRRKGDGASVTIMQLVDFETGSKTAKKEEKAADSKKEKAPKKTEKTTDKSEKAEVKKETSKEKEDTD